MNEEKVNSICGIRLKECLKEKNMTQKELANLTLYTSQYISNIITGKKPMSVKSAYQFAEILGVRAEYLLNKSNHKTIAEKNNTLLNFCIECAGGFFSVLAFNGIFISQEIITYKDGNIHYNKPDDKLFMFLIMNNSLPSITENSTILKIEYDIRFDLKTYRVDHTRIKELISFIQEFLEVKRNVLYKDCIEKGLFEEIK